MVFKGNKIIIMKVSCNWNFELVIECAATEIDSICLCVFGLTICWLSFQFFKQPATEIRIIYIFSYDFWILTFKIQIKKLLYIIIIFLRTTTN